MSKVLITGSGGALGRAIVNQLTTDGGTELVSPGRATLNISNKAHIESVIAQVKPDTILHLAASFAADFEHAYRINVESSKTILETVSRSDQLTKVILIGSAAEYGHVLADGNPVKETHILQPVSIYGVTKAWQTQLMNLYASLGVDVAVARIFNLYGRGISQQLFAGSLQAQIDGVLSGERETIKLGDLSSTRDYISTKHAARQVIAISKYAESGHVYNVASGEPITMKDLLQRYLRHNNLDESIVRYAGTLSSRSSYNVSMIYADISKIKKLLEVEQKFAEN